MKNEFRIHESINISDQELAKIYSECILTICPQKYEMFGYVVAESVSCGTPVLAFNCMGIAEIITHSRLGYLANNKKDFIKKIECFVPKKIKSKEGPYLWDISYSSKMLKHIIEQTND